ncbi:histone-lysine N-methyltransferase SETMAR-like [Hydra vulgaris]|uniref:Histone-lysine N-methyltransferase SETMAR-like n=1 Tax=Hydra vulgaris TaxID=6087 RepID=A0ABM4CRY8_HYDVU
MNGRESLEDDPRSGHPQTTYTAENIERVRAIIEENPHATHDIVEALTSINRFTINEIIHNALKKRKLTSRWIPHELTDQNRKNRVEACVIHLGYVEKGDTITSEYYKKNCLKPLICEINKQRPKTGIQNFKFLHDNARPHVTETVTNCLNQAGITIIRHQPYSPDLAPSDYWLFDLIKKNLDDDTDVKSQKTRITKLLQSIPKEVYKKTFDKWLERMQLCIDNDGHYFEHLIK